MQLFGTQISLSPIFASTALSVSRVILPSPSVHGSLPLSSLNLDMHFLRGLLPRIERPYGRLEAPIIPSQPMPGNRIDLVPGTSSSFTIGLVDPTTARAIPS